MLTSSRRKETYDDPSTFAEILKNIKPVASNSVCKVTVVEKRWYDLLLLWLNGMGPKPGRMDLTPLLSGTHLRSDMVYGVDYEVIPSVVFTKIKDRFDGLFGYERNLLLDPSTNKPIVLFKSIALQFKYEHRTIRKEAHGDWKIGDVKSQLCGTLKLDPSRYTIKSENTGAFISEDTTVSAVTKQFPGAIRLSLSVEQTPRRSEFSTPKRTVRMLDTDSSRSPSPRRTPPKPDPPRELSVLDILKLNAVSPFPKPAGLVNLGNTCFFNSAVQCLARVQPLTAYLLSPAFERQLNTRNPQGSGGRIASAYRDFLMDLCSGGTHARNPSNLRATIVQKYRTFANYGQQDSQELLGALLDGLHEDLNQSKAAGGRVSSPVKPNADMDSWQLHNAKNCSPIQDLFHGRLFSSIHCSECGNVECVYDPFMFLSVPVPRVSGRTVKLIDCLNSFSQEDKLDANNKWKCPKCKKLVCATKRLGVDACAPILIIQLKRFSGHSLRSTKIETCVEYPAIIDSAEFCRKSDCGKYRLIGAVFHSGGLGGGHYVAVAWDAPSERWFNFNDSIATPVNEAGVHSSKAYILFYQLCC